MQVGSRNDHMGIHIENERELLCPIYEDEPYSNSNKIKSKIFNDDNLTFYANSFSEFDLSKDFEEFGDIINKYNNINKRTNLIKETTSSPSLRVKGKRSKKSFRTKKIIKLPIFKYVEKNNPHCINKQKNKNRLPRDIVKKTLEYQLQKKYYPHPWMDKIKVIKNLGLQNISLRYLYINTCSQARVMDYIFPMNLSMFYNAEENWSPLMEQLSTLKRIYKIENDGTKKRYRVYVEEKDRNFLSESSMDDENNMSRLTKWLTNIRNKKATDFGISLNNFCKAMMAKSNKKPLSNRIEGSIEYESRISRQTDTLTYSLEDFTPPQRSGGDSVERILSYDKLSPVMKEWIKTKPYVKTQTCFDYSKRTVQTSYIDLSYALCLLTKSKPTLNDIGGAHLFKTKDFYKSCTEFFDQKISQKTWKCSQAARPHVMYGPETKLFDLDGNMIEGDVIVYNESFRTNKKFYLNSTTILLEKEF